MKIVIAKEFTSYPEGRYRSDSKYSGEVFRDEYLIPNFHKVLKNQDKLEIVFDGVLMLGSSFLEEAFGGMVRELKKQGIDLNLIEKHIIITAKSDEYAPYIEKTKKYMQRATEM